jgi:predicted  nucleic acid-binding Zn-ribbon protein
VAEISPTDLRRLETLDSRLQKARAERQKLTAERGKLRAAATENAKRARELAKELGGAEKKLEAALAENAALAAKLEETAADLERLQTASLDLREKLDGADSEIEKAKKSAAAAEAEAASLHEERDRLAESLSLVNAQLAGESIAPVLPAAEVSELVHGFVSSLSSRLSGMTVRDGELQLKVGFEKVGRTSGFVVPSSESPPEVRESLHELSIRFGRIAETDG